MPINKINYFRSLAIKNNDIKDVNFYSLGNQCRVRQSIQRYFRIVTLQTGVFDWIGSDFNTVLYFFENIDIPLKNEDFYDTNKKCSECRIIKHKNINFYSLHDMHENINFEDGIKDFIEKYNRRLIRLKEKINDDKKIHFIHTFLPYEDKIYIPSQDELDKFILAINKINPNCNFNLHLLVPPLDLDIKEKLNKLVLHEKIFLHYLTKDDTIINRGSEDECRHWSWFDIYNKITYNDKI